MTCLALSPTGGIAPLTGCSFSIEPHFCGALDLHWRQHLRMQSAWQQGVDGAVSKTINLDQSTPVDVVKHIYKQALLDPFIKGLTVYRSGCESDSAPVAVG